MDVFNRMQDTIIPYPGRAISAGYSVVLNGILFGSIQEAYNYLLGEGFSSLEAMDYIWILQHEYQFPSTPITANIRRPR